MVRHLGGYRARQPLTLAFTLTLTLGADSSAGLEPAEQALLSGVVCALPWNLKIIAAFVSDTVPLCGLRRLPYLLLGLALQGGGWLLLGILDTHATLSIIAAQQFVVTLGQVGSGLIS